MNLTLVVLAAGMGSRYGGLKQLDPVGPNGETIIDYSVFDAIRAGFDKAVFVIRPEFEEQFKEKITTRFQDKIELDYCYQALEDMPDGFSVPADRDKPWGTGHAVLVTKSKVSAPFAVINADDFYGHKAFLQLGEHLKSAKNISSTDYCMIGFVLRNTLSEFGSVARGVCTCDTQGYLQSVEEITNIEKQGNRVRYTDPDGAEHKLTGDEVVSMNMWGFTPSLYGHLETRFKDFLSQKAGDINAEFYIPTAVHELIKTGHAKVKVLQSGEQWFKAGAKEKQADPDKADDQWFGLTYQKDKSFALQHMEELISQGTYPQQLWR